MVAAEGQLPTRWGKIQIVPVLQNLPRRRLWGNSPSETLAKVIELGKQADEARQRIELQEYTKKVGAEQEKIRAEQDAINERARAAKERARQRLYIGMLAGAVVMIGLGWLLYGHVEHLRGELAKKQAEVRRITALAGDALWSDGPAAALLIESQVEEGRYQRGSRRRSVCCSQASISSVNKGISPGRTTRWSMALLIPQRETP